MNDLCPDAFFVRRPEAEKTQGVPLFGYLHILAPAADESAALRCASVVADQLCWPELMPAETAMPLWKDPPDEWSYEAPTLIEMRQRLATAPVVVVVMLANGPDRVTFSYAPLPQAMADRLNAITAASLIPFRVEAMQ